MIHIYLLIFVGINGMSYHWWSAFALLSKPGKQIYGIYKYVFFEDFGATKYLIFNYPRITLEFVTWWFNQINPVAHIATYTWLIALESKGAISVTGMEKEEIPANQRDYNTEPGAAPSSLTLQAKAAHRQRTLAPPAPQTSKDLKSEQNFHWSACPLFPCSFPNKHHSLSSQLS